MVKYSKQYHLDCLVTYVKTIKMCFNIDQHELYTSRNEECECNP